jgi:hypothetical protein
MRTEEVAIIILVFTRGSIPPGFTRTAHLTTSLARMSSTRTAHALSEPRWLHLSLGLCRVRMARALDWSLDQHGGGCRLRLTPVCGPLGVAKYPRQSSNVNGHGRQPAGVPLVRPATCLVHATGTATCHWSGAAGAGARPPPRCRVPPPSPRARGLDAHDQIITHHSVINNSNVRQDRQSDTLTVSESGIRIP